MCKIVNFYQYKYCKKNYFINIVISKIAIEGISILLSEKLNEKNLSKEYRCAYTVLKYNINRSKEHGIYIILKINKCYLRYLKDLYYDFYNREESIYIKDLVFHIQGFVNEDINNILEFYELNENIKINVISNM